MDKEIKISFILPFKARRPAGGFRVMYEYANRLVEIGYDVQLIYPIKTRFMKYRLPYIVRYILTLLEGFRTCKWFSFNQNIKMSYVAEVKDIYIPDADIVIATWWSTALDMGALSPSKGKKINLIQGFENWEGHENLLYSSYNIKDTVNIVVATYLVDIVKKYTDNKTILIHNAVDEKHFYVKKAIDTRSSFSVAMIYSTQEIKGSKYGVEALKLVKERLPQLEVDLFGICAEPENLPDWMTFYRNPNDLPALYNRNAIFITNSFTEGFSLVPVEAMFCGCAVICTDIQGHKDYGIEGETALLVESGNVQEMADRICYLIENNDERIALAKRANEFAQRFRWDNAVTKMNDVICDFLKFK